MLPIFAIIGRPNVGKSTLFNALTKTRNALVADEPGVTRDRQYGEGNIDHQSFFVVDTGGIAGYDDPDLASLTEQQVYQAVQEADIILFVVDAKAGLTPVDQEIAQKLRPYQKKVILVVNKIDRGDATLLISEFYNLGFEKVYPISAASNRGVITMMESLLEPFPKNPPNVLKENGIAVAIIGRPNVGKSTLINRLLGEERAIVFDKPGTTRDSIFIPFERRGQKYTLIDTAGVRRKSRIDEAIEKFSVIKSMQAVEKAQVVILVIDAREGITDQDLRLIHLVLKIGRGLMIALNKWDGLSDYKKKQIKNVISRDLKFVDYVKSYFISAKEGTGVGKLFQAVKAIYRASTRELTTSELTGALEKAVQNHQPPSIQGRRIRLRYAHLGGHHPLLIIIHGKQTDDLPPSYQQYLAHYFRKTFDLAGIPIHIRLKNDRNPYVKG